MKIDIQPADPQRDYPYIAERLTQWRGNITSVDVLHEKDHLQIEGKIRRWDVAFNQDREYLGIAYVVRYPSEPARRFHGYVIVDTDWQKKGVGTALYEHSLAFMQTHQAAEWHSWVNEGDLVSLRFAEDRGFKTAFQAFDSALKLAAFDETPFENLVENVEAGGIRFFTFDTVSHDPQAQRQLYEINRLTGLDEPSTDSFASFDTWKKIVLNAAWFHHDCEFIAADRDRYVGFSGAFPTDGPLVYENGFTGVDPDYRGRKIAQALKLLSIRHAVSRSAAEIRTSNDSRNAPMLAVNRKLGYLPLPGHYGVIKKFDTSTG